MKKQQNKPITLPMGQIEYITPPTGQVGGEEFVVAKAKFLVAQGDLDAAEQLLCSIPHTPASLDLMARLYGQKGEWRNAQTAWENLLRIDPHHSAATDALRRLASNWLFKSVAVRVAQLTALAALLVLSAAGLLYISSVLHERPPSSSYVNFISRRPASVPTPPSIQPPHAGAASMQVAVKPLEDPASTPENAGPSATISPAAQLPKALAFEPSPLPDLNIAGAMVSTNDGQISIVFDEGIFRYRCELSESAERSLHNIITALSICPPVKRLQIIGHTDDVPMPPGGPFPDNYALGFARAATVASWFRQNTTVPPEVLVATSSGAANPPFSNADYDSRLRNRTVVLRVQFQEPATEDQP